MPNHVTQNLTVTGSDQAALDALRALMPEGMDFEAILPMPKSLDIISGSATELARALLLYRLGISATIKKQAERYQIDPANEAALAAWITEVEQKPVKRTSEIDNTEQISIIDLALIIAENCLKYGYETWYDWANNTWGTKWNAYGVSVNTEAYRYETTYQTAWSVPFPVLEALSARFSTLQFHVTYFDEGWNFAGKAVIKNGETNDSPVDMEDKEATRALYIECYGEPPEEDDEDEAADED